MDLISEQWKDVGRVIWVPDVRDFPSPRYTKQQVNEAGKALGGIIPDDTPDAHEIFRIAYNWRDAHMYPMYKIKGELQRKIRKTNAAGLAAARPKAMRSIRRKLSKTPLKLGAIRDLAGCRAILPSMKEVKELVAVYLDGASSHGFRAPLDYIGQPQRGGYRSYHLPMEFLAATDEEAPYDRFQVELQIRTRVQHAWATAVEAVGLYRGEHLKGGEGSADWLRLFRLMSIQLAEEEQTFIPDDAADRSLRRKEIMDLNDRLGATEMLRNIGSAFRLADSLPRTAAYVLIKYDRQNEAVSVKSYSGAVQGAEANDVDSGETVLVQVDKIENLKDAYPNYFGDVRLFRDRLVECVRGYKPPGL
jgi:ppGpp synthetase/RelA/SpoT-type nucleotidyltranferase